MALEQFEIIYLNIFSNYTATLLFIWISVGLSWIYLLVFQVSLKSLCKSILVVINQQVTNIHFFIYLPLLFSLLFFILNSNYNGLIMYTLTITSHIWLTFSISLSCFIGITIIGYLNNQKNLKNFFIPAGITNIFLLYFVIFIEILSYLMRPLSLSIRLFANMLAGHTLLFILGNSVLSTKSYGVWGLNIIPLLIVAAILLLELAIAGIQAYVFWILSIIYLSDMYNVINH